MQQRHIQERVQLEEQFNREIDAAKAEARAHMAETRQAEREELIAEQEKVSSTLRESTLITLTFLVFFFFFFFLPLHYKVEYNSLFTFTFRNSWN